MSGACVPAALLQEKAGADEHDLLVETALATHLSSDNMPCLCRCQINHSWPCGSIPDTSPHHSIMAAASTHLIWA